MQGVISIPLASRSPVVLKRDAAARSPAVVMDEFVAGPENRLAAVAVKSLLESASPQVMPLVLYGATQSGKTHLAMGVADWWHKHHPAARVVVTTGGDFAQQFADAIETDRVAAWRSRLYAADFLVIDDLPQLAGKRGVMQELRLLLDDLLARNVPVIVTSRTAPAAITGINDGLRSRLADGLAVPVATPGPQARLMLLERFCLQSDLRVANQVLQEIAAGLEGTVPELIGTLAELQQIDGDKSDLLDAGNLRRFMAQRKARTAPTLRALAQVVTKYFNVKLADLRGASRRKALVNARDIVVYLARQTTTHSLEQIGNYLGGRDHTTILHGYRKLEKMVKTDAATRQTIADLMRLLETQT